MFDVPSMKKLPPVLAGLGVPDLPLVQLPRVDGGEGPAERALLAGSLVSATLYEAYARARRQRGIEPVMVIACPDCVVGRDMIAKRRGQALLDELTGPVVWAWSEQEAAGALGEAGWKHLSAGLDTIGHADGGMRLLLAVNGTAVEPRVFRMAEPTAAPTPALTPAVAAPAAPILEAKPMASEEGAAGTPAAATAPGAAEPPPATT
jgi:hypothetical protein